MQLPKIPSKIKKMPRKAIMSKRVGNSKAFKDSLKQFKANQESNDGVYFREGQKHVILQK